MRERERRRDLDRFLGEAIARECKLGERAVLLQHRADLEDRRMGNLVVRHIEVLEVHVALVELTCSRKVDGRIALIAHCRTKHLTNAFNCIAQSCHTSNDWYS